MYFFFGIMSFIQVDQVADATVNISGEGIMGEGGGQEIKLVYHQIITFGLWHFLIQKVVVVRIISHP